MGRRFGFGGAAGWWGTEKAWFWGVVGGGGWDGRKGGGGCSGLCFKKKKIRKRESLGPGEPGNNMKSLKQRN